MLYKKQRREVSKKIKKRQTLLQKEMKNILTAQEV